MKIKLKTVLYVVLVTNILMGLSATAHTQTPQSCHDGYEYLISNKYKKSIKKLSNCLKYNSLPMESKSLLYYNRAAAYHMLSYEVDTLDKSLDLLEKAYDDIQKSIEIDPVNRPLSYCIRGLINLDGSFGAYGHKDLEKGITMGAPEELCNENTLN